MQDKQNLFNKFWSVYPRRVAKRVAYESFIKSPDDAKTIIDGALKYAEYVSKNNIEQKFVLHPSTFINQGRYEDEYELNLPKKEDGETQRWRLRVSSFYEKGYWQESWGARPNEIGCCAPSFLIKTEQKSNVIDLFSRIAS